VKIGVLTDTSTFAFAAVKAINSSEHELLFHVPKGKLHIDTHKEDLVDDKIVLTEKELYEYDMKNVDLLISYCFPSLIREPIISAPKFGCINFHPAPLPKYRGFAVYNFGILNNEKCWAVTSHCIDARFDTGDIIKIIEFDMSTSETAESLRRKSHIQMLRLLRIVLDDFENLFENRKRQEGESVYYSRKMLNEVRKIKPNDSMAIIEQKVRAFWCPPHHGASLTIKGKQFTIVSSELLESIGRQKNG